MPRSQYYVYVIELSRRVYSESRKFRDANPQFNGVLQCLYVGMTSKSPKERLQQHLSGYKSKRGIKISSSIVEKYGKYLRPSLYNHLNTEPMCREEALDMERQLALYLRKKGYAVWFN